MTSGPYQALINDQLADERAKKNSLEQRGFAVISTSGTLVTITLGFVALATRTPTYKIGTTVMVLLVVALAALVVAAGTGLVVNLPAQLPVVDADELGAAADDDAPTTGDEAEILVQLLKKLRQVNHRRARLLFIALLVEVVALAVMAAAVVAALLPIVNS